MTAAAGERRKRSRKAKVPWLTAPSSKTPAVLFNTEVGEVFIAAYKYTVTHTHL